MQKFPIITAFFIFTVSSMNYRIHDSPLSSSQNKALVVESLILGKNLVCEDPSTIKVFIKNSKTYFITSFEDIKEYHNQALLSLENSAFFTKRIKPKIDKVFNVQNKIDESIKEHIEKILKNLDKESHLFLHYLWLQDFYKEGDLNIQNYDQINKAILRENRRLLKVSLTPCSARSQDFQFIGFKNLYTNYPSFASYESFEGFVTRLYFYYKYPKNYPLYEEPSLPLHKPFKEWSFPLPYQPGQGFLNL